MKTKHIFLLALASVVFASCENYFDEKYLGNSDYKPSDVRTSMTYTLTSDDVVAIGKQCTHKGNDTVPSVYEQKALSLCTPDDSSAYTNWLQISKLKSFTEEASADIYVPMFMAQKFPYLDAGTICNVTYPLYEGKSARVEPFRFTTPYTLTEDDYRTIWNGRGASYISSETEAALPAFLAKTFPLAADGKIIVLTYNYRSAEPDSIIPFLPYDCSVAQLLEAKETEEHRLTGTVGTVKSTIYGRFYLVDGQDSIYVYGLSDEEGNRVWKDKGIQKGDLITVKGYYSDESSEPQFINAVYVSHTPANAGVPRRMSQQASVQDGPKTVIYQLKDGAWSIFQNDQLTAALALQPALYEQMGSDVIADAQKTIGDWLRRTFLYPHDKEIYLVAYNTASGYTADEWTYNGTDFVMNTGFVDDVMSFVYNGSWIANISTYYTTPFVGDGPADFTMQTVALDGLNYIWRYQAAYGMTASAYVSGTNHPVEGWLVSPKIRLKKSTAPELTFYHAVRYGNPVSNLEWLKVKVTNNYTGDVTTTEWKHLEFTDSIPDGSNWVFRNAGRFDLSEYNGESIVIGFEYNTTIGEVPSAPTWEIQDLLVAEKEEVDAFIKAGNEKRGITQ
ncbi:MAG: choice-of-anchor J domain-containing protein [Paludibacteraceae bacterium]|nr:choice-of-anchor J domain-containing protein [Paludibacteraceae bacterium]